jgi:hypothetical protein
MDFWISRSLFTVGKGARGAVPNSACAVSHPRTSGLARAVTFKLYGHFGVWSRILTCSASALEASDAWRGSLETQGGPCVTGNLPKRQDSRSCRRDEGSAGGTWPATCRSWTLPWPCTRRCRYGCLLVVVSRQTSSTGKQLASEWRWLVRPHVRNWSRPDLYLLSVLVYCMPDYFFDVQYL